MFIWKKTIHFNKILTAALTGLLTCMTLVSCAKEPSAPQKAAPYDGKDYIQESELTSAGEDPDGAFDSYTLTNNYDSALSVPTYVTKIDDLWFIVDCYHNRIIYSDTLGIELNQWKIMTGDVTQPHTIASDGVVYLVDDTENNRVQVFEKVDSKFINTQTIYNIGNRPHYTIYDKATDTFYVWSSTTGEMYLFRHTADSSLMYLTEVRKIDALNGIYVRSFSIIDGDIYFVSSVSEAGTPGRIYQCDLNSFEIKKEIPVPDTLAGMVQITRIQNYYYITTSTDLSGDQNHATIVRTPSLSELSKGNYEDIYAQYFIGGGTPYYISEVDGTYFLTEHRLKDHSIWRFKVEKNKITDVTALY
jgi:hypothetical protein